MVVRYGIHKKEESVPILIKARKLMREKGLSKWEAIDKIVDEEKKKGRITFFVLIGVMIAMTIAVILFLRRRKGLISR
jgi:uncharacterized membrane protein